MSVNKIEISLPADAAALNRRLGILAVAGAPMLLIFFMFGNPDGAAAKTLQDRIFAVTGVFYIGGWLCGAIGMRRRRATGNGFGAKAAFIIQLALLGCALLFSLLETAGFNYENGGWLFAVADAGYPLSHLFMIVVGVLVWRARVWSGLAQVAPLLVGFALPVFFALSGGAGTAAAGFGFGLLTAVGLGTIGWQIIKSAK